MSSSAPRPGSSGDGHGDVHGDGCGGGGGGEGGSKEEAVAKAAGFVVFSGIAMNIIKALSPKLPLKQQHQQQPPQPQPSPPPPAPHASAAKPPVVSEDEPRGWPEPPRAPRTVEIVQGDTLWGFSRKYGVPISEIKKANGLTGDTIYAGKKLVIP